jgi:hypothetical protein
MASNRKESVKSIKKRVVDRRFERMQQQAREKLQVLLEHDVAQKAVDEFRRSQRASDNSGV